LVLGSCRWGAEEDEGGNEGEQAGAVHGGGHTTYNQSGVPIRSIQATSNPSRVYTAWRPAIRGPTIPSHFHPGRGHRIIISSRCSIL
jgi:hypothetical protein